MKIAIPTKDDIHIVNDLDEATGFMVFTIQFGDILEEEFRSIKSSQPKINGSAISDIIHDCSVLFTSESIEKKNKINGNLGNRVIKTGETNITKIVINYLNSTLIRESNTLCCP